VNVINDTDVPEFVHFTDCSFPPMWTDRRKKVPLYLTIQNPCWSGKLKLSQNGGPAYQATFDRCGLACS
jgi:hypothetical protein